MAGRRANGEQYLQSLPVSDFVAFVGRDSREAWTERVWQPEVRINGTNEGCVHAAPAR